jgi:hypothetical protein
MIREQILSEKQPALIPIAAFAAVGEIPQLNIALRRGLDAGFTVSQTKEVLVQMYAYAGFPRSPAKGMRLNNDTRQPQNLCIDLVDVLMQDSPTNFIDET